MSMSQARGRTRWSALAASALIQCCAGSSYCFGPYSPALKASQGYDQSALDAVAFFEDVGANAGVLSGLPSAWAPVGFRRPWLVLLAGAALCAAGYLPMWLAVAGVAPASLLLMCFYMLLAAQAQTFLNTAVENFPDRRGTVIGIMKVRCFPSLRALFYCSLFPINLECENLWDSGLFILCGLIREWRLDRYFALYSMQEIDSGYHQWRSYVKSRGANAPRPPARKAIIP
jgi:hypothetical protein